VTALPDPSGSFGDFVDSRLFQAVIAYSPAYEFQITQMSEMLNTGMKGGIVPNRNTGDEGATLNTVMMKNRPSGMKFNKENSDWC
jgi:hypothetical protein